MKDTYVTWENMTDSEIEQSIVTKPAWAAQMVRKCFDDKHTYKGNYESAMELLEVKKARIAELEREKAKLNREKATLNEKNRILSEDLQDCWEQKSQLEQQIGGAA